MRGMTTRALVWGAFGGLLAGTLDILYATSFWALRDVPAQRIFQSIAAGYPDFLGFDLSVNLLQDIFTHNYLPLL